MFGSSDEALAHLAAWLDIPDELYEDAVAKYTELGAFLTEADAKLGRREPQVYPQGSFRLGTMIRPISDAGEYDIDLVYRRDLLKGSTTHEQLKREAGENLRAFVRLKEQEEDDPPSLTEKRRCWTLGYEGRFHMDALPSIPDIDVPPNAIHLTDRKLRGWQDSDPADYAGWFVGRMAAEFQRERVAYAKRAQASVESVPDWRIKTTLQRSIQLLKRHRDLYFREREDDKPASIIVTTLAAQAYTDEGDLLRTLKKIARDMPKHIVQRDGKYLIVNPAYSKENFADRWNEEPKRAEHFATWVQRVQRDLDAIAQSPASSVLTKLGTVFGEGAAKGAAARISPAPLVKTADAEVPALADTRHVLAAPWPEVKTLHRVKVRGSVYSASRRKFMSYMSSDRAVPKGVALKFEADTNIPGPYTVKWQVTNTGAEARAEDDLRGDFYDSDNPAAKCRWENARYAGTHWVEAFIVKDGRTIGRSGRYLVRIRSGR